MLLSRSTASNIVSSSMAYISCTVSLQHTIKMIDRTDPSSYATFVLVSVITENKAFFLHDIHLYFERLDSRFS